MMRIESEISQEPWYLRQCVNKYLFVPLQATQAMVEMAVLATQMEMIATNLGHSTTICGRLIRRGEGLVKRNQQDCLECGRGSSGQEE